MNQIITIILSVVSASGILGIACAAIINRMKRSESRQTALELGVQALLRDRMIYSYNKYTEIGNAPIYAKENFSNMYKQYHELGANGVMTKLYEEFMTLPVEPKNGKGE